MNLRSLCFKLALYYGLTAGAVFGASGYFAYQLISSQFQRHFDQQLEAKASLLKRSIRFQGEKPVFEIEGGRESQYAFSTVSRYVMITDHAGEVLYQTDELLLLEPTFKRGPMRAAGGQEARFATLPTELKETVRFVQLPLQDPHGHSYLIHVGAPFTQVEQYQRQLLWGLVGLVMVLFALSVAGGWFLAKRSLQPVDEMARLARQLGGNNLSARLAVPPTRDEISTLAETFNEMISRLQEQFERVKQFNADVSHELRTPLTVMQGENEVALRSRLSEEEYRTVLISNLEELERMNRIVSDLLILARADAGDLEIQRTPIDLSATAADVCEQFRPLAEQSGKNLKCHAAGCATILGDAAQLRRLVVNLVDNALKCTPGGGTIEVRTQVEGATVLLSVVDSGVGISEAEQEKIFERFYRGSRQPDKLRSAGLGLSIVRQIVHSHGGQITVKSQPGAGTAFEVTIPERRS
ncbi:MAG: heavy metal sensor histidine kinase [Acidobacteria bacterium]|nr:heavy metal sensor histidine kinase [Acidobacteriota bacterium]